MHGSRPEIKRYTVTAALPYANGPLHIGHLAGAYLSADVYVRFQRLMGKDIVFIGGSDEHGAAITMKALKENRSPKEGSTGKKLYVWMDAPIGYISATKQWAIDNNKDWEPYWKAEDTALIHFIGKDNIVFHCLTFPTILKAEGSFILPYNVPANQFMNLEGRKLSTSRGWAVWVKDYLASYADRVDELRYCLIKFMPESKDSEFTWKGYQDAVNNELVNNLANFFNRVVVLTNKYYDGRLPDFDQDLEIVGAAGQDEIAFHDSEILGLFDDLHELCNYIRQFDFRQALNQLMIISSKGNQILQFNEPWKKIKEDPDTVKVVLNLALQYVSALAVAARPFIPFASDKMTEVLGMDSIKDEGDLDELLFKLCEGELLLNPGHKIGKPIHLFSKIGDDVIEAELDKLNSVLHRDEEVEEIVASSKPSIDFNEFQKLDIRTATILEAEKVKKTDKLLKLTLDIGNETRTVVSGIAQSYEPEEIVGKQVSILLNLKPRKIKGVESQGMILMAEDADGSLKFVAPEQKTQNGSVIS